MPRARTATSAATATASATRSTCPAGGGPFQVDVELLYQPIGFRWAHNLEKYDAPEPKRFVGYYNEMSSASWVAIAKTTANAQ